MSRVVTVNNFLSTQECQRLIDRLELVGFQEQLSGDLNRVIRTRCVFEDLSLAMELWARLQPFVAALSRSYDDSFKPEPAIRYPLSSYQACGLNEVFRCYKYRPGEQFRRHQDFAHEWDHSKRTFLTVLVYLNDNFTGGETCFGESTVNPEAGSVVIFPHELPHEGRPVDSGIKYVLRSDVAFSVEHK